jgi:tyrosyl-DNA phosphodiesterase-1
MKSPRKSDVAPAKRRRLNNATEDETYGTLAASASLSRPISPPLSSRQTPVRTALLQATAATWSFDDVPKQTETPPPSQKPPLSQPASKSVLPTAIQQTTEKNDASATTECIASPVQLTRIRDLAPHQNVDTVQLKDILGDPLIRECWNFNFLFDIDFVM